MKTFPTWESSQSKMLARQIYVSLKTLYRVSYQADGKRKKHRLSYWYENPPSATYYLIVQDMVDSHKSSVILVLRMNCMNYLILQHEQSISLDDSSLPIRMLLNTKIKNKHLKLYFDSFFVIPHFIGFYTIVRFFICDTS